MKRILLSPAQVSAVECRMHGSEQVDGLVLDGRYLVVHDVERVAAAVNDASSAEDEWAERGGDGAVFARRSARSLAAIYGKVLRLAAHSTTESL